MSRRHFGLEPVEVRSLLAGSIGLALVVLRSHCSTTGGSAA